MKQNGLVATKVNQRSNEGDCILVKLYINRINKNAEHKASQRKKKKWQVNKRTRIEKLWLVVE